MKTNFYFLTLASVLLFSLLGCSGASKSQVIAPDTQAQNDPDGKTAKLFAEFDALEAGDRETWVRSNDITWSVIQNVKDPALKTRYEQEIKPILGH